MLHVKNKPVVRLLALLSVLTVLLPLAFVPGEAAASGFLPTREYDGQMYEARAPGELTNILLIGYDHNDDGDLSTENADFAHGGQSDFLLLVVLDHEAQQIRRLQFDRDTMTRIKMYGIFGGYLGPRRMQLCLAHAYGDTQEKNNANAIWAVEELLGIGAEDDGVQIDWYMSMDISGIDRLNEVLGGVTVTIEDDFTHLDPAMAPGTTLRLTGHQAELYCRNRMTVGDGSNAARMVRQRQYINSAGQLLIEETRKDVNFPRRVLNEMGVIYDTGKTLDDGFGFSTSDYPGTPVGENSSAYLMTSETLDGIVAQVAKAINYELMEQETLPGQHTLGSDGFIQYILEEGAADAWAIDVFYDPIG